MVNVAFHCPLIIFFGTTALTSTFRLRTNILPAVAVEFAHFAGIAAYAFCLIDFFLF